LPKVLSIVSKKVKEATAYMQEALAETMGLMVYFIVNKVGSMGLEASNEESINDSRIAKLEEAQH
jgi:hypothetical protein